MATDYREITVTITNGEETARVWTNIPKYRNRLVKLGATITRSTTTGTFLDAPSAWFWPRKRRQVPGGTKPPQFAKKPRA